MDRGVDSVTYEITAAVRREHFAKTFPEGVELTREEWNVLASWPETGGES